MRVLAFVLVLAGCSSTSSVPERAAESPPAEQKAAVHTEECLDNPELAKKWGECNVKQTVFHASEDLAKCRHASPGAKGTVSFQLRVGADGTVKQVKDLGGKHGKHTACVTRVLKGLRFAAPGKEATITVPYQLEP